MQGTQKWEKLRNFLIESLEGAEAGGTSGSRKHDSSYLEPNGRTRQQMKPRNR